MAKKREDPYEVGQVCSFRISDEMVAEWLNQQKDVRLAIHNLILSQREPMWIDGFKEDLLARVRAMIESTPVQITQTVSEPTQTAEAQSTLSDADIQKGREIAQALIDWC